MNWIFENANWIFSGIGVVVLCSFVSAAKKGHVFQKMLNHFFLPQYTQKHLRHILMLSNSPVGITLPFFMCPGTTWNSSQTKKMIMVTHDESAIPLTVSKILKSAKYNNEILVYAPREKTGVPEVNKMRYLTDFSFNRIVCGGPYTNPDTFEILKRILPQMKFSCTLESYNAAVTENNEFVKTFAEPQECIGTTERYIRYGLNSNEVIFFDRIYCNMGVIIRLTGKDAFKNSEKGTIHIWFGLSTTATMHIVNSFLCGSNSIYELTKNNEGNYAFIIPILLGGDIDFSQAIDITQHLQP